MHDDNTRDARAAATEGEHRSIPTLLRDLAEDMRGLVRDEVRLARAEVGERVDQVTGGMAAVGGGALVLFAGLLVLLDAAVAAVAAMLETPYAWLPPLLVGGVVAVVGAWVLLSGKKRARKGTRAPERSARSMRSDKNLIKEKLT